MCRVQTPYQDCFCLLQDVTDMGARKGALELGWWYMPVISALGRLRQEDCEFQERKARRERGRNKLGRKGLPLPPS
jgi:hypothetical protein